MSSIPGLEHLEKEGWEVVKFDYASRGEWLVDALHGLHEVTETEV